jgi:hypothetical protein
VTGRDQGPRPVSRYSLNAVQASVRLGYSLSHVHTLVNKGELSSRVHPRKGCRMFDPAELDAFKAARALIHDGKEHRKRARARAVDRAIKKLRNRHMAEYRAIYVQELALEEEAIDKWGLAVAPANPVKQTNLKGDDAQ